MSHHVTHFELHRYREEGYFLRERVLGEAQLEPLREAVEAVHRRIVDDAAGGDAGPSSGWTTSATRRWRAPWSSGSGATAQPRSAPWSPTIISMRNSMH